MTAPADAPPTPPPTRSPLGSLGIGFRAPDPTTPDLGTIPSPASSPEETEPAPAAASATEPPSDEPHDEMPASPGSTSSRGSTRAANPLVGEGLRDMARNGVIIASHQASQFLARTEGQRQVQLYLADDDDAANIGDPLARIAARRDGVGEMNPDTADLLAAMMGLAGYASKQIQRSAVAKKLDAGYVDGVQPMPTPADIGGEVPA